MKIVAIHHGLLNLRPYYKIIYKEIYKEYMNTYRQNRYLIVYYNYTI